MLEAWIAWGTRRRSLSLALVLFLKLRRTYPFQSGLIPRETLMPPNLQCPNLNRASMPISGPTTRTEREVLWLQSYTEGQCSTPYIRLMIVSQPNLPGMLTSCRSTSISTSTMLMDLVVLYLLKLYRAPAFQPLMSCLDS